MLERCCSQVPMPSISKLLSAGVGWQVSAHLAVRPSAAGSGLPSAEDRREGAGREGRKRRNAWCLPSLPALHVRTELTLNFARTST